MTTRPLSVIRDDAIASLRRFATTDPADRTPILREVAVALVDAREHFFTSDGSTDWRGRTYAYRRFVGEVFASPANKDQRSKGGLYLQGAQRGFRRRRTR